MSRRRTAVVVVALAAALSACGRPDPPRDIEVGTHRVTARIPAGWEIFEQGQQALFKAPPLTDAQYRELDRSGKLPHNPLAAVRLRDFGPVLPEGLKREIGDIEDQWRAGRVAYARTKMQALETTRALLPGLFAQEDFRVAWATNMTAPDDEPYTDAVAANFATILSLLDATPPPTLGKLADWALPRLGHDGRRDIASRKLVSVGGREAEEIETWNRLSHTSSQRLLFMTDGGSLLVLHSEPASGEDNTRAYETIRASLQFTRAGAADAARR